MEPEWFRKPTEAGYSVDTYWFGVGQSARLKRSIDEAKATVAGQIETTISQKTIMKDTETQTGLVSQYRKFRQSDIRSTIRQTLANVQIVKQENAGGRYYVMAVLDKAQYQSGLRSQLQQLNRDLNIELAYQNVLESANRYEQALIKFDSLLAKAKQYNTLLTVYNYIASTPFMPQYDGLTLVDIQAKHAAFMAAFSFDSETPTAINVGLGQLADTPVRVRLRWKDNPVANVQIRVTYSDGTVLGDYTTNADGGVAIQPYGLPLAASEQYIEAHLRLTGPAQQWQAALPAPVKSFYTLSNRTLTPVAVTVDAADAGWNKQLKRPLRSAFRAIGYSVDDSAIAVQARVDIESEKTMKSYQKNNYYIAGSLVLTAYHDGQPVMAPVSIPFKALAKNRKKAIQTIANDMVFPKIQMLELLVLTGGHEE